MVSLLVDEQGSSSVNHNRDKEVKMWMKHARLVVEIEIGAESRNRTVCFRSFLLFQIVYII